MAIHNIYIIGPQATGKTTLFKILRERLRDQLGEKYLDLCVPELARRIISRDQITSDDILTNPEIQRNFLKTQFDIERLLIGRMSSHSYPEPFDFWLSDRSGLDTAVYSYIHHGQAAGDRLMQNPFFQNVVDRMKEGTVILCEAGTPWMEEDGVRIVPADREGWKEIERCFRSVCEKCGVDYVVIPSNVLDLETRVQIVLKAFYANNPAIRPFMKPVEIS